MERDGQLELYDLVAARLKYAHAAVRSLDVTDDERRVLVRRLLVITTAAKKDLRGAVRRLDRFIAELDSGRPVEGWSRSEGDASP